MRDLLLVAAVVVLFLVVILAAADRGLVPTYATHEEAVAARLRAPWVPGR